MRRNVPARYTGRDVSSLISPLFPIINHIPSLKNRSYFFTRSITQAINMLSLWKSKNILSHTKGDKNIALSF